MAAGSRGSRIGRLLAPGAGVIAYAILPLLLSYPLVLSPKTAVISQWEIDTDHSLWIQWWFTRAVDSPKLSLFETDLIRFPDPVNLQLADINLAVNLPSYLIGKAAGPIAAHNLMLWISFVAAAGLMWALARRLCGSSAAAWLAGLVFAASSYWISCAINSWQYLVHIGVFPLAFLALWRLADRRRLRDFAGAGLATALVFHVSPYYLLFLVALLVALAPWYTAQIALLWRAPRGPLGFALGGAVVLAAVAPRALPMYQAGLAAYAVHSGPLDTVLAAHPLELVMPSVERPDRLRDGTFLVVFLSYTVPGVIAVGLLLSARRAAYWSWLAAAALMFVLALGPLAEWETASGSIEARLPGYWLAQLPGFRSLTNPWRWSLPGVFCLAVAFSIALADATRFARERIGIRPGWLLAFVFAAYLAEVLLVFPFPFRKPVRVIRPDPISTALREIDAVKAIVDFRSHAKLHQMQHQKRIVGGWLPRVELQSVERTQQLLAALRERPHDNAQLLGALGIGAIVIDDATAWRVVPHRRRAGSFELRPLRAPGVQTSAASAEGARSDGEREALAGSEVDRD